MDQAATLAEPALALGIARSATGRRWIWRQGEARTGLAIAQRLGLPELVGRLLAARGVGVEEAAHFLEPTLRALLPDPSSLRDMDAAASRLAGVSSGVPGSSSSCSGWPSCAASAAASLSRSAGLRRVSRSTTSSQRGGLAV